MRALFGCLAVLLGAVSIALAARYGYKGADTVIDGVISAVVFGVIALCAFMFDAAAVRLWFMRHRLGAVGDRPASAAAALVVTFTNSLGAIAGRADTTQAERARATDEVAADRAELDAAGRASAQPSPSAPATADAVTAGREAVAAAERIRLAECGNGDPRQRGPNCRSARDRGAGQARQPWPPCSGDQGGDRPGPPSSMPPWQPSAPDWPMRPAVQNANPLGATLEAAAGRWRRGSDGLAAGHRRRCVRALPRRRDGHLRAARAREAASHSSG